MKTIFNILGPLLNPAWVPFAVVGVYKQDIVSLISSVNKIRLCVRVFKLIIMSCVGQQDGQSTTKLWHDESISCSF